MKKLIAISVVFALIATAAFADVNVGGQAGATASLFGGSNQQVPDPASDSDGWKGSDILTSFGHFGNINISGQNDEGTFGGFARLNSDYGFNAWWKPVDVLRVQLGRHYYPFALPTIGAWGFNAMANDLGITGPDFGGWDDWSFWGWGGSLELTPIDGLSIAYYVQVGNGDWNGTALDAFGYSAGRLAYSIDGVGTIVAKVAAGRMDLYKYFDSEFSGELDEDAGWQGSIPAAPRLALAFDLGAIEGVGLTVGLSYNLPQNYNDSDNDYKVTFNSPFSVGVGFSAGITDTIGIKVRVKGEFGASTVTEVKGADTVTAKGDTYLGLDILPNFDFGIAKFFLHAGFGASIPDEGDTEIGFQINPYIEKALGPGSFMIGFKLWSGINDTWNNKDGEAQRKISWGVPVGMYIGF